jgi:hypothetical protein
MAAPPQSVVDAIENGTTTVTRRAELYEADGETLWTPGGSEDSRLIDGSVGLDYGRDERRSLDLTLDNEDNALRPDPDNGLWYDKIIKCYRGVTFATPTETPAVAIVEADTTAAGFEIKDILIRLGFVHVDILTSVAEYEEVRDYKIIVSYMRQGVTAKGALLADAFQNGLSVLTVGSNNTPTSLPLILATGTAGQSQSYGIAQVAGDNPVKATWVDEVEGTYTGYSPLTFAAGVRVVAQRTAANTNPMAGILTHTSGGRWFHYQPPIFGTQAKILLGNALNWLWGYTPYTSWETQLGEFMIDNISEDHWPYRTKITGRDYTKKCLVSKLQQTMQFDSSTSLDTLITALASNAGVTKFNIPSTPEVVGSGMAFDRTTDRWAVMKKAADANNYELFFDARGYLTMRKYKDPVLSPLSHTFKTGSAGNLVRWSRSTNDSRLYNHIIVTGESASEDTLPFFGEARNEEPSSPTRIERIGDRSYFYTSSFFTSDAQCEALALRWLKEKALESYELSWDSFNYPWLEVGEIVEFLDPRRLDQEPTRFLLDSLSIPLGLGPMGSTAKRVTFVNDPGLGGL